MVKLKDVDRYFQEGFCEYRECAKNENGFCYLWFPPDCFNVEEDEYVVNADGSCCDIVADWLKD